MSLRFESSWGIESDGWVICLCDLIVVLKIKAVNE